MDENEVWRILSEQPLFEKDEPLKPFDEASWLELNMFMQNQLLRDVDVMGMAHGIEIRVPFLDKEFVDLSMSISDEVKSRGSLPKQLLIDSFKNTLPEPIWNRPKMGFGFPFRKWLSNNDFVQSLIPPDQNNYINFAGGNMHWSQFLSLVLLKYRGISDTSPRLSAQPGKNKETGSKSFSTNGASKNESFTNSKVKDVMFLTLRTFSLTGGIEKVSKVAGKALYELCENAGKNISIYSMYDKTGDVDEKYIPKKNFTGFGIKRLSFTQKAILRGIKNDVIILSHINLLPVGYFVKLFSPKTTLILIAHGIEAWKAFKGVKKDNAV